jgi:tetratricopeptide (TPR) repeat protein
MFYPKEWFGEPVLLNFEDGIFPAPSQYYRFLRSQFGDTWMIIPDAEHQEDHNTFDNYNVPCKTFIADYTPFINFGQLKKDNEVRKAHNLRLLEEKKKTAKTEADALCVFWNTEFHSLLGELSTEAEELLKQERYEELAEMYSYYCDIQLSEPFIKHDIALGASTSVLYTCVLAMIMSGNFGRAEKLIRASKAESEEMNELKKMITDIRGCMLAAEEERYEDAVQLAEKWHERFPLQLNLAAFMIGQGVRENQNTEELLERTRMLQLQYPNSDECMYLMALLLEKQGKQEEAVQWYQRCLKISRNGMLRMKILAVSSL